MILLSNALDHDHIKRTSSAYIGCLSFILMLIVMLDGYYVCSKESIKNLKI